MLRESQYRRYVAVSIKGIIAFISNLLVLPIVVFVLEHKCDQIPGWLDLEVAISGSDR